MNDPRECGLCTNSDERRAVTGNGRATSGRRHDQGHGDDDDWSWDEGLGGNYRSVPSIGEMGATDNVQREKGRDAA